MTEPDRDDEGPGLGPPPIPPADHPNPASEDEVRDADDEERRRLEEA
jgi:hypothetical protein